MKFTLLTTGGTIDSYSDLTQDGAIIPTKKSVVVNFLNNLQPYFSFDHTFICSKDSRDITTADRKKILATIKKSKNEYILVTHGTYTMPETGRFLEKFGSSIIKNKVIIFTGSMSTLIGTIDEEGRLVASDGTFNLGFAIASFTSLSPGIYLSMNGKIFSPMKVQKNPNKLRFFE